MPSTPLRRRLRGAGHSLSAQVRVGKEGVTPALMKHLNEALFDHELVKVKMEAECPQDRFEVAEALGEGPGVNVVQILGKTVLVYKRHPSEPRYEGKAVAGPVTTSAGGAPVTTRGSARRRN